MKKLLSRLAASAADAASVLTSLISSSLKTSRQQIIAYVSVRFSGCSSGLTDPKSGFK